MAELFGVDVRTVSEHLKNIFASRELTAETVIRKFRITASDGKNYQTQFYSLDAIISVGYRVSSPMRNAVAPHRPNRQIHDIRCVARHARKLYFADEGYYASADFWTPD